MDRDREICILKGKSEDECQNYVRVLAKTDTHSLLVCGTNSFKPKCRTYSSIREEVNNATNATNIIDTGVLELKHEFSGKAICPPDPKHNSTAIFTGGELYSGTVSDFSGTDALIYRNPLRTEQYDLKHLNAPDFVSSTEDEDYVYFFFREAAVEYINCGKAVYSRVARVCKKDHGGAHKFQQRWTTYLKARLNCSVPGDFPFYFNEIQATTEFVTKQNDKIIYATFTTPDNSMAGSAICSFKLSDIRKAFDTEAFKGQKTSDSNWLKVQDVPVPRPGQCSDNSKALSESHLNFIKGHSLMDSAVNSADNQPLYVKTALHERLTAIAVDPNVRTPGDDNSEFYDVIYVGTTKGKVLKVISSRSVFGSTIKPIISEEIQVCTYHVPVTNLQVVKNRLIVVSDHEVKSMPLHRCSAVQVQSCAACIQLRDPHCAWNVITRKCVDKTEYTQFDASELLQDIYYGKHPACSENAKISTRIEPNIVANRVEIAPTEEIDIVMVNELENEILVEPRRSDETVYTGSSMITASVVTALSCLLVGFLMGFFTSRRCSKDYKSCGHHYLEQHLNKQNESTTSLRNDSGYTPTPCNNLTSIDHSKNNLLVNVPTKTDIEKNNINNKTSSATTVIHNGTLPKNGTLCKKVYL